MPVKKKTIKSVAKPRIKPKAKFTLPDESIEAQATPEPRMTVVTEIVEDNTQNETMKLPETNEIKQPIAEQLNELKTEDVTDSSEISTVATPGLEPTAPSEKTKELVEELFKPEPAMKIMPEISIQSGGGNKRSIFIWAIVLIVIVVVIAAGMIFIVRGGVSKLPSFSFKPQPTPTLAPTATPTPPKKEDLTIDVINGGGTAGAAGKMKAYLTGLGYQVVSTGNTEEYTFTDTEIHVKPDKAAYLELLKSDLNGTYTIGASGADLSASTSADAEIIVGK